MYCPKCRNSLPDNSMFCDKCGCSMIEDDIGSHVRTPVYESNNGSSKTKTWIENLNLSKFQRINAIIALCAAALLLICIDGSIYMWLYATAAVSVLIAVVKKISYKHIFSAVIPSIMLLAYIITDFVTVAARQRLQAVNIIMQIIFACAVAILWIFSAHPKFQDKNKTTAILMIVSMSCIAVTAIFLLISFFINLRYIGVFFRIPLGNLGNSAALVSYVLFLSNEGKTIQWIKEALHTPTVQQWSPYQRNTVTSNSIPYNTPIENDIDDSVVCAACGYRLPKGSMFCDNCGSSLRSTSTVAENDGSADNHSDQDKPVPDTSDTVICPTCGSEVDGDSTFCEYCGAPISFPEKIPSMTEPNTVPLYNVDSNADTDAANDKSVFDNNFAAKSASQAQNVYSQPEPPVIPKQAPPIVDERLGFLNQNEILIDEKLSTFKFANSYRVYDLIGNNIGTIQQVNISGGAKAARVLLGKNTKGLQQFHYKILDNNGKQLAAVHRDGGAFSQIRIVDSNEKTVGYLSRGKVYSPSDELLCSLKSDWKGWNLTLTDPAGNPIGEVKKKWNGVGKELFTSADKYYVSVNPSVTGNTRIAIFGSAVIYDILLHER